MWPAIICGLILYKLFKCFFYDDDVLDIEASDSTVLFSLSNRFQFSASRFHFCFFIFNFMYYSWIKFLKFGFFFVTGFKSFLVEKFLWVFEFLMLILLHHKPLISFFSLNGISFFATILYSCFTLLLMYNVWFKLRCYNSLKMEQHKNINVCNVTSMFVCFLVGWLICLSYSFYLFCLVKWRIGYLFVILLVVLTSPRADLSLCLVSQ
jgi:hypothetical protein